MRIVQWDGSDPAAIQECYQVLPAEHAADDPFGPPPSLRRLQSWLEHPVDPAEVWLAEGSIAGHPDGWYRLRLPDKENRDRGGLGLSVHPAARRRGIGTALPRHAATRAASHHRSVLRGEVFQDSPGAAFARRMGATPGLVDARRVLTLAKIPVGRVAALREQAAHAAAGYSLVTWLGRTPHPYLAGFAEGLNAANHI